MITEAYEKLESLDAFAIQILSKGSFVDRCCPPDLYQIDSYTIRLNPAANNEYLYASTANPRSCYESQEEYDANVEQHKTLIAAWEKKITDDLGLPNNGVTIRRIVSEVFGVVHIRKIEQVWREP